MIYVNLWHGLQSVPTTGHAGVPWKDVTKWLVWYFCEGWISQAEVWRLGGSFPMEFHLLDCTHCFLRQWRNPISRVECRGTTNISGWVHKHVARELMEKNVHFVWWPRVVTSTCVCIFCELPVLCGMRASGWQSNWLLLEPSVFICTICRRTNGKMHVALRCGIYNWGKRKGKLKDTLGHNPWTLGFMSQH